MTAEAVVDAAERLCEALLLVLEHAEDAPVGAVSVSSTVLAEVVPLVTVRSAALLAAARAAEAASSLATAATSRKDPVSTRQIAPLEQLRAELAAKDALIATYAAKIATWRRDFDALRTELATALDSLPSPS